MGLDERRKGPLRKSHCPVQPVLTAASYKDTHTALTPPPGLQITDSQSGRLRGVILHHRVSLASFSMEMWQGHHALYEPMGGNRWMD